MVDFTFYPQILIPQKLLWLPIAKMPSSIWQSVMALLVFPLMSVSQQHQNLLIALSSKA